MKICNQVRKYLPELLIILKTIKNVGFLSMETAVQESKNIFAAVGAGNLSQELLIKIASGQVSGIMNLNGLSGSASRYEADRKDPVQNMIQQIIDQMERFESLYKDTQSQISHSLFQARERVEAHVSHLSTNEREELFHDLDYAIENPNDYEALIEYDETARELGVVRPDQLYVDRKTEMELEGLQNDLAAFDPNKISPDDVGEDSIKAVRDIQNQSQDIMNSQDQWLSDYHAALESQDYEQQPISVSESIEEDQEAAINVRAHFNPTAQGTIEKDLDPAVPTNAPALKF